MKKFKPLNILDNKGFWPEKAAVADAIKEILALGRCRMPLPVADWGHFQSSQWRDENNRLVPWRSVEWYVYDALDEERMQVDSSRILENLSREPYREEDHYDLFVLEEDMYDPAEAGPGAQGYVVGRSRPFTAAVISTSRIEHIWGMPYSYLKTEVMRQLCYMFGVPDIRREDVTAEGQELHCQNVCILRAAYVAPNDWERLTEDRLTSGALCERCTNDLRRFFEQVAQERN